LILHLKGSFDEDNKFRTSLDNLIDPRFLQESHRSQLKLSSQFVKDA
jgi:hypothetical protein